MLLIECPYCDEERPEIEFDYAGEAHIERPREPAQVSDVAWMEHLFIRSNARGVHFERWRHTHGCARFFNAVRDTVTDKFLLTYKAGRHRPSDAEIQRGRR